MRVSRSPQLRRNPPWVNQVITQSYEEMEAAVPPGWLPRIASGTPGGALEVAEYGCGAYGCVLPTHDFGVVLKVTSDDTEAEFASNYAAGLSAPVCVRYHLVLRTAEKYNGRSVYLLWRDAAADVGNILEFLGQQASVYLGAQHRAGQAAFAAAARTPGVAYTMAALWAKSCEAMAQQPEFPELRALGRGLATIWNEQHILFGDVHKGNLGLVNNQWVITDPGNIAVIEAGAIAAAVAAHEDDLPAGVVLVGRRYGAPSARMFQVLAPGASAVVVPRAAAQERLRRALPAGFRIGTAIDPGQNFRVVLGVPRYENIMPNTFYLVRPSELLEHAPIWAGDTVRGDVVARVLDQWSIMNDTDPVVIGMQSDGGLFAERWEAAMAATRTDRVIAAVFTGVRAPVPDYAVDITGDMRRRLPSTIASASD